MLEHYFGLIEAIFVFGLAIAFYVWQMRDLRKADAEAKARERQRQEDERAAANQPGPPQA